MLAKTLIAAGASAAGIMATYAPPEIVIPNEIKFPAPEKLGSKNSRDPRHTPFMFPQ